MKTSRKRQSVAAAVAGAALIVAGVPVAQAAFKGRAASTSSPQPSGWDSVVREPVSINLGKGWTAKGELDTPRGAKGRLPVVVLLHGSGPNDMNQSLLPGGKASTFVPITQTATKAGFAVLRFNKRGVTDVGPVLSKDPAQLAPKHPYRQILRDAGAVVRFAARSPRVDPARIYLLGHSEGTQVASNLAADPKAAGIPKPAGVIEMGVVGLEVKQMISLQINGVKMVRLHDESDIDGDGFLTYREAADGLIGLPKADADTYRKVLIKGRKVNPGTDRNHDGRLSIDAEVGAVFRKLTGIGAYPNVPSVDKSTREYLVDIARFPTASKDLPRFDGSVLLLNGENDIQTPARAAIVTDAAVAAAGNRDHKLITYPGMAHTMNLTTKFAPKYADPAPAVLKDIQRWLADHR
jgi:uncharacterized protein